MTPLIESDAIGFLVADISRLIRAEFDRRIAEAGISVTAGEARTLVHAARAGEVRQTVLAERMGVEPMTLSGYLDRLEERGFVARKPDPSDRRAKLVSLTDASADVLAEIRAKTASIREDVSRNIEAVEWSRLLDTLKKVRANLAGLRSAEPKESRAA
jgi:DNA-binding MarR family transcriptional regulator